MTAAARQLEDALARLERLERKLDALLARGRAPAGGGAALVTKRAAARILGCDRGTTLEQLIRSGRLPTVTAPSGKGLRIPRAELERVLREGPVQVVTPATRDARSGKATRAKDRTASAAALTAEIRAIPVPQIEE